MFKQVNDLFGVARLDVVLRVADNTYIPFDEQNSDYVAYLAWLSKGNQPIPAGEA